MLWIKEVEMVDSADDLMSSSSIRGIQMPNFEVLVARIASALNRIRFLAPEMKTMKEKPWSRIIGQNRVNKEVLETVGNGNLTGSVQKETIAVSDTI